MNNSSCGERLPSDYSFYLDGVLVSIFGIFGLLGNIFTLLVLSRPGLQDCFHRLLTALACFDTIYILCGGVNFTFRAFHAGSSVFTVLFPHVIHPFTYIGMTGSVLMTLAISIERFLGICHPLTYPPHTRKAWYYVLPVLIISMASNIPRFLEVCLTWSEAHGPGYQPTLLRTSETYIRFYRTYFHVLFTAILPLVLILVLNLRIIADLRNIKVQRFGSRKKLNKELNLFFILLNIVVTFLLLHSPRIIVDVYEFLLLAPALQCHREEQLWSPHTGIAVLTHVSHLALIISSGLNFVIYSLVGHTFRREFRRLLRWRPRSRTLSYSHRTNLSDLGSRRHSPGSHNLEDDLPSSSPLPHSPPLPLTFPSSSPLHHTSPPLPLTLPSSSPVPHTSPVIPLTLSYSSPPLSLPQTSPLLPSSNPFSI